MAEEIQTDNLENPKEISNQVSLLVHSPTNLAANPVERSLETNENLKHLPVEDETQGNMETVNDIDYPAVIHLEKQDLNYTETYYSTVILKESKNIKKVKLVTQKEYEFDDEKEKYLYPDLDGNQICYTQTGEKFIIRNGLRIFLKPISEERGQFTSSEIRLIGIFLLVILVLSLMSSELLYIEFDEVAYIPFGVISLSIVHAVTVYEFKKNKKIQAITKENRKEILFESTEPFFV